jgi:hypothetical protein
MRSYLHHGKSDGRGVHKSSTSQHEISVITSICLSGLDKLLLLEITISTAISNVLITSETSLGTCKFEKNYSLARAFK